MFQMFVSSFACLSVEMGFYFCFSVPTAGLAHRWYSLKAC